MTELLAPAGSDEALKAAVMSGADAVYAGGIKFSARAGAKNIEDMAAAAAYCHKYGVKLYAAVNTLFKEKELAELVEYALYLNSCGVDGVIIQDAGAFEIFKETVPELERHASTQMTAADRYDAQYLYERGFSRVVLARELTKEEIADVREHTDAELEVFVHGAICMCYSGQCLMSSIIGGRSGNRGRCAQPCRQYYTITENGVKIAGGYVLSPRDLALVDNVTELEDMGIDSLKIEGRLKRGEYVAAVTGVYRRCLDERRKAQKEDIKELTDAFSRGGFTDGYYTGKLGAAMMCHDDPSNTAANIFTEDAKKRASGIGRTVGVSMSCVIAEGEPARLYMRDNDGHYIEKSSISLAERARNKPADAERIRSQLEKLGGTGYNAESVTVETDGAGVIPIREINDMRRRAVADMDLARTAFEKRPSKKACLEIGCDRGKRDPELAAGVLTPEQAAAAAECGVKRIFAPLPLAERLDKEYPHIDVTAVTGPDEKRDTKIQQVEIATAGGIKKYSGKRLIGGARLNITNSYSAKFYSELDEITLSPELNLREARECLEHIGSRAGVIVYGRLELMVTKNCPLKAMGKCRRHKAGCCLKDKTGEEFPVICTEQCVPRILNSKPVYMADKPSELLSLNADTWRLNFTTEDAPAVKEIINRYKAAVHGIKAEPMKQNTFTRGHFMRGVM